MDRSEEPEQQVMDNAGQIIYSMPQFHYGPAATTGIPGVQMYTPKQLPLGSTSQQQQFPYPQVQHFYQQQQGHQQNKLQTFWNNQMQEVEETMDFKNHSLPLARIKRVMKSDKNVRMISAEAPLLFAKACEMFILELTLRSWIHTEENKRKTLRKNDIVAAISRADVFDFLVKIVAKDEIKEEAFGVTRATFPPLSAPADFVPYYYVQQQYAIGQAGLYPDQQSYPTMPYIPWQQPQKNHDQSQQNGNC